MLPVTELTAAHIPELSHRYLRERSWKQHKSKAYRCSFGEYGLQHSFARTYLFQCCELLESRHDLSLLRKLYVDGVLLGRELVLEVELLRFRQGILELFLHAKIDTI